MIDDNRVYVIQGRNLNLMLTLLDDLKEVALDYAELVGDDLEMVDNKFEKLIGISITANEIDKILSSLGFKCKKSQKAIKVEVPSWRPDVSLDEDLIEELIRIKGFNNIKLIEPSKNRNQDTLNFKQKLFHLSQRSLASKGYMEIVTWSFTDSKIDKQFSKGEKEIPIYNPISSDLDVLRRSVFSNLAIYLKKKSNLRFH